MDGMKEPGSLRVDSVEGGSRSRADGESESVQSAPSVRISMLRRDGCALQLRLRLVWDVWCGGCVCA